MTTALRFRDHSGFHRAAAAMAVAGVVGGCAAGALFDLSQSPWGLGIVAAATALGAVSVLSDRVWHWLVAVALVAAGAAALALAPAGERLLGVGAFAVLCGAALAGGTRGRRLLIAVGAGAGTILLARHALISIATAEELAGVPSAALAAMAGAAFSFVSVLALLPRHVSIEHDRVAEAYASIRGEAKGEVAELAERGMALWSKIDGRLDDGDPNRDVFRDAVLRLLEVAQRWQRVEADQPHTMASSLVERMERLDTRIAESDDDVVKGQYKQARQALADQLRYLEDIRKDRDRVLARMHNYLAAMEQLRLAVVNLESTNASRRAGDIQPLVADLHELGRDIDCASTVLVDDAVN